MNNHNTYNFIKPFKKGLSRTIIFLIVSMMGIGSAWADTWDGTTKTAPNMTTNNGSSEALAIQISKAAELAWLGDQIRQGLIANGKTYGGKYWKLTADINLGGKNDFTGHDWASMIGNTGNAFCGYFDGGGHTVSNIQVASATSKKYYGLFPSIQGASTTDVSMVKNLKINGAYFKATATDMANTTRIGALAGYVKQANVSNIAISNVKFQYTGGITNENDLGGAIGCAETTASIESVSVTTVDANFTGTTTNLYVAGLVGKINSLTTVSKCSVSDVTITYNTIANASRIAGLIGYTKGAAGTPITINGCSVSNTKVNLKAGINNGSYIGTLVAQAADNTQIGDGTDANKNIVTSPDINIGGDIMAASYIGGAIGDLAGATDATKTSVVNKLTVISPKITINNYSAGTSLTGGVFGRVSTFTAVDGVNLTGTTFSFTKDLTVAQQIGTFAGTITGNATQQISVKNVSIDKSELTFGSSTTSNTAGLKAGIIGQVNNNVLLDTWKVTGNANIKVNGNLITSSSNLGSFAGYVTTGANAPVHIKNIEFKGESTVSVSGNTQNATQYLGGFIGYLITGNNTDTKVVVDNVKINGQTTVSIAGTIGNSQLKADNTIEYKGDARVGGFAGLIQGRAQSNNSVEINAVTLNNVSLTASGKIVTSSHFGGFAGQATTGCVFDNWKITSQSKLNIGGDITATSYVGGAFGNVTGATNYPATLTNMTVEGMDISFGGNLSKTLYVGGIAGQLAAIATTPNKIENCTVSGKIHSNGNHTFKENETYAFGGIVGYTDQSATNISEIRQCTSNVDFNLSGLTPATKNNLYRNGFVVGGIIGRMNTPSRLPEHLYYTGKIYAPYAAVSPIVGVFYTKIAAATYLYDDYIGINAANLTPEEWLKANTWYYSNYKLGLSEDVVKQTVRTKNYKISPIKEDGVNYLLIDDKVFDRPNAISGVAKNSSTVLAYNASSSNADFGIYPAWNTSSNITPYPSYYMYYMQGLNRGTYTPDDEVNFVMTLMDNGVTYNPTLTRTGNDQTGFIFTVSSGDLENNERFTITYQWYQSDKTTPIIGETGKTLSISKDALETFGNTIYCVVTVSGDGFNDVSRTLQGTYTIVVFVDGAKGIDNEGTSRERGWTPETAVRTIDHANSLLANAKNGGTWDKNIIVVMGILNDDHKFQSSGRNPATLTGKWDGVDYKGVIRLAQIDPAEGEHSLNMANQPGKKGSNCYILGDTKFENLTFYGKQGGNAFIELHGHNAFFGKGLVMQNFKNLSKEHGNFGGVQKIPEFTIILTATNLGETDIQEYTRNRTKPQEVTFQSGHYGRIMAGRFTQDFFAKTDNSAHSILASAKNPLWAVIKIAIDKDNEMTDGLGNAYSCDINAVIAGLTDGTMYGDMEINFHGGNVAYIVGSNQGNAINNGNAEYTPIGSTKSGNYGQWPNSSYFGRTVINIEQDPDAKNITVGNLYTGGLGRKVQSGTATAPVDMYLYGQTEVNVKSGTVGSVYGGGVGGVIGINPWDAHLPYATTATNDATAAIQNGVQYGDTRQGNWSNLDAATAPMAKVILHNYNENNGTFTTEALDLSKSSTTINITGGNINGSVFGGGYGYVPDMPEASVVQGVGSVFGTSNINISGGNISGSVYGGSQGASNYYGKTNTYGQTITHIAEMNGTVNLRISGTDAIWPTIGGNIYGGGAGVSTSGKQEYLRIATTGNNDLGNEFKTDYSSSINVIIDLPKSHPFTGNIYGGGQMGRVDGSTKVIINDGIIKGDIFGGGKGEIGHPDKAKVTGNTNVIVVDKK